MFKLIASIAVLAAAVLSGPAQARSGFCAPDDPLCYNGSTQEVARSKFCPPKDPLCAY